jgi:uncharacterized protein YndB with AHSA1/START domain
VIEFAIETDIARPVGDVFAYVIDPTKLSSWQTNTVSAVPEGNEPIGLGSRLREVHRAPGGKELASLVEVSEFERDRLFGLRMVEGPLPIHARIAFAPIGEGTRMRFAAYGQPRGAMRLAAPLLRRTLKRQFAGYCKTLKRVLEE